MSHYEILRVESPDHNCWEGGGFDCFSQHTVAVSILRSVSDTQTHIRTHEISE